jgi:transcriptional regulator with XRE-family HTH domain
VLYHRRMPRARSIDPNARRFGAVIFELRARRGWTFADLGKASGMHPDWLCILEFGRNVPSLNTILKLAKAFDIEAAELVRRVEELRRSDGVA